MKFYIPDKVSEEERLRSMFYRLTARLGRRWEISLHVKGFRMFANTLDRMLALILWRYGLLEGFEYKFVKTLVKPGMVVIDIGANIGFYTLVFAEGVGPFGKVFAIEPAAQNCVLLRKNLESNNISNTIILEKAAGSKTEEISLFESRVHQGDHRTYPIVGDVDEIKIQAVAIDDIIDQEQTVDLIKMDIQGFEFQALKGMVDTLTNNLKIKVVTEFSPYLLRKAGDDPGVLLENMMLMGFELKVIDEESETIQKTTKSELLESLGTGKKFVSLFLERP